MKRHLLMLAPLAFAMPAIAGEVYKCQKGETIVFSEVPCAPNAEKVDTSRSLRTGSGGEEAVQQISDSVEDARCRRDAESRTTGASASRIAGLQQEKDALELRTRYARNNLAGATWESGLRQQIGAIETSIQQERSSAMQAERDALKACDDQARARAEQRAARASTEVSTPINSTGTPPTD